MKQEALSFAGLCGIIALIAGLDHATGDELELFVLYIIPVALAAWYIGLRSACVLAFLSVAIWAWVNERILHEYSRPFYSYWSELVMLTTFLAAAYASWRIGQLFRQQQHLNEELFTAMERIKKLSGQLPICMNCKNIESPDRHWHSVEEYFTDHSEDDFIFQRTICPECAASRKKFSRELTF